MARDTRDAIGGFLFPSIIACILMVLFTTINMFLCCCTNDKMYYGSLIATGLIILVGTVVMAFLGISCEAPEVIQTCCEYDRLCSENRQSDPYENDHPRSDLRNITDGIHIGFWIILAVNGTFGLWILLLAIFKFCSANQDQDEQEKNQTFVPIQL